MYQLDGNSREKITVDGIQYSTWKIVQDGVMIATLVGPCSAPVALAAIERLSGETEKWNWYSWTDRLQKLFVKKD